MGGQKKRRQGQKEGRLNTRTEKWTQWRKERRRQGRQDEQRKGHKGTTKGKKLGWKDKEEQGRK